LPQENIAEMSDPAQPQIKQLASQLSQSHWDSALWLQLLGFEANETMQQQVQTAFLGFELEFTQERAGAS